MSVHDATLVQPFLVVLNLGLDKLLSELRGPGKHGLSTSSPSQGVLLGHPLAVNRSPVEVWVLGRKGWHSATPQHQEPKSEVEIPLQLGATINIVLDGVALWATLHQAVGCRLETREELVCLGSAACTLDLRLRKATLDLLVCQLLLLSGQGFCSLFHLKKFALVGPRESGSATDNRDARLLELLHAPRDELCLGLEKNASHLSILIPVGAHFQALPSRLERSKLPWNEMAPGRISSAAAMTSLAGPPLLL